MFPTPHMLLSYEVLFFHFLSRDLTTPRISNHRHIWTTCFLLGWFLKSWTLRTCGSWHAPAVWVDFTTPYLWMLDTTRPVKFSTFCGCWWMMTFLEVISSSYRSWLVQVTVGVSHLRLILGLSTSRCRQAVLGIQKAQLEAKFGGILGA